MNQQQFNTYLRPASRIGLFFTVLFLAFGFRGISAPVLTPEPASAIASMTKEQKEARLAEMKERVLEIKAMDKSTMSKADRKALRAELKNMNKEAKSMGYTSGIYISVGALIIIILLLILIL
jgi:hypothetical protein